LTAVRSLYFLTKLRASRIGGMWTSGLCEKFIV
jgi:hypothetical protein